MVAARATLVDTSVWVALLRPRFVPRLHAIVNGLSEADLIWTSKIVVAELIAGLSDQKAAAALERDFQGFRLCEDSVLLFRQAAFLRLGMQRLRRPAPVCGLIDAYLACLAARERRQVLTADAAMAHACSFLKVPGSLYSQSDGTFMRFRARGARR